MRCIRLYRLGSDPEFVFVNQGKVVPAPTFTGTADLHSFIGVDGHNATAELRPKPWFNVKRALLDLAVGIHYAHQASQDYSPTTRLVALPVVLNEVLGGHIHASYFAPDGANEHSSVWFASVLGKLLIPLEASLQPFELRSQRNMRYGIGRDVVRPGESSTPKVLPRTIRYWCYRHLEYRMPSSWLHHPILAYLYLGLAKFSLLNPDVVSELPSLDLASAGTNRMSAVWCSNALTEAWSRGVVTPDLRGIPGAWKTASAPTGAAVWLNPESTVNVEEWQHLIPDGVPETCVVTPDLTALTITPPRDTTAEDPEDDPDDHEPDDNGLGEPTTTPLEEQILMRGERTLRAQRWANAR